jgi:sporulation protein YabP
VVSFEDTAVVLRTSMGNLVIHGRDLQLKNLSLEGGQASVDGTVNAMVYEEVKPAGGWLRRILG